MIESIKRNLSTKNSIFFSILFHFRHKPSKKKTFSKGLITLSSDCLRFFFRLLFYSCHFSTIVNGRKKETSQNKINISIRRPLWESGGKTWIISAFLFSQSFVFFYFCRLVSYCIVSGDCIVKCETIGDFLRRFWDYGQKEKKSRRKTASAAATTASASVLCNAILFMLHEQKNHKYFVYDSESYCCREWMQWWHKLVNRFKGLSNWWQWHQGVHGACEMFGAYGFPLRQNWFTNGFKINEKNGSDCKRSS